MVQNLWKWWITIKFLFLCIRNQKLNKWTISFFLFPNFSWALLEPVLFACVVTYNFVVGCNNFKVLVDLFKIALSLGFGTIWTVLSKWGFCFILRIVLDFSFSNHGEHSANILNILKKNVFFFLGGGFILCLCFFWFFGGMCEVFCKLFMTSGIFVFISVKQTWIYKLLWRFFQMRVVLMKIYPNGGLVLMCGLCFFLSLLLGVEFSQGSWGCKTRQEQGPFTRVVGRTKARDPWSFWPLWHWWLW